MIQDNTVNVLQEIKSRKRKALEEISPKVVRSAHRFVPVVSGDLQQSIEGQITDDKLTIGSPLVYAPKVEVNTPYLRPALEENRRSIREAFTNI